MNWMAWTPGEGIGSRFSCLPPRQTIPYAATSRSWLLLTIPPNHPRVT